MLMNICMEMKSETEFKLNFTEVYAIQLNNISYTDIGLELIL